jgi:hypothetical protein
MVWLRVPTIFDLARKHEGVNAAGASPGAFT